MILLEFFVYLIVITVIFSAVIGLTAYMRFARQEPGKGRRDTSPSRGQPATPRHEKAGTGPGFK